MKIYLNENQVLSLKRYKKIFESYDDNEFGEYGELIDIKFNILIETDEDGDTYENYKIIEFNTIKNENFKPNEICCFYELGDYFGDDVAFQMEEYEKNKSNLIGEYVNDDGNNVSEYSCYLKLNDINEIINNDPNGYLKKYYGVTENFESAIWLMEDGTLLDGDEGNGYRTIDHNSIESALNISYEDAMNQGLIRLMPESPGFEIHRLPTYNQEIMLTKFIKYYADDTIYIDFGDGVYATYKSPHHYSKILSDINDYFVDGIKPLKVN